MFDLKENGSRKKALCMYEDMTGPRHVFRIVGGDIMI
jgi:hypothetical protein